MHEFEVVVETIMTARFTVEAEEIQEAIVVAERNVGSHEAEPSDTRVVSIKEVG